MISKLLDSIKQNNKILILTHKGPDGDAVGSVCALGLMLKEMGKDITYIVDSMLSEKLKINNEANFFSASTTEAFDLAIALDCSELDYLYDRKYLEKANQVIVIDHHITNKKYGDMNYVCESAAAVGEIIIDMYEYANIQISSQAAAWLYLSLATDTGNFRYSNVTANTHRKVAKLYEIRDDFSAINKKIEEYGLTRLTYLSKIINNIKMFSGNKVIISYISLNDYVNKIMDEEADMQLQNMIDILRNVESVEVAVLIKQADRELFKVSLRSNGDFDVAAVAKSYGGGGHKKAAGCNISGDIDTIIKNVASKIEIN
jgi:phosphoesterase RecJ-like protein